MHTHNWFGIGATYRTLVTEDGYLHPAAAAHSAMAWFLEDTKFVKSSAPAEGVSAYIFQANNRTVTVLSPRPGHAPYKLPVGSFDLFGNPVPAGRLLDNRTAYVVASGRTGSLVQ
jgi:hypothetical protein